MRRIVGSPVQREVLTDIPFGKRESENCMGGVVRTEGECERASVWRDPGAMLGIPHLAICDEVSRLTASRAGRKGRERIW